jgi:hypothetical protein
MPPDYDEQNDDELAEEQASINEPRFTEEEIAAAEIRSSNNQKGSTSI